MQTIDPLYVMGIQPIGRTKQKKFSLLGIEIYSHVNKSCCSVLQIGCISTGLQGVHIRAVYWTHEKLYHKPNISDPK